MATLATAQVGWTQGTVSADSTNKKKPRYTPKITGVIQVHYLNEFNTNGDTLRDPDGFRVLRARLTAKGKISKKISYELMIDPRAPEMGGIMRDAFLAFDVLKNHTVRVGQQKTQFGWENRESSTELYTVNRAEMSDGLSRGETLRDIGVGILGEIKLSKHLRIEDAFTFTNGTASTVSGPYDFNGKKALWGRAGLHYKKDNLHVRWGTSIGLGGLRRLGDNLMDPADDIYTVISAFGTDIQVENDYFFLAGEYGFGKETASDTLVAEPTGYQVLLAVKTKWRAGPLVRYDTFEDEWKVLTCGAYYGQPKDRFRILVNYVFRGKVLDVPGRHDDRLYVQMQIVF